ncbi:MAG TPA: hypothetical protein VF832_11935 [Longimicrobiales bacterium]
MAPPPAGPGIPRREFLQRSALLAAGAATLSALEPGTAAAELLAGADPLAARGRLDVGELTLGNATIEGVWSAGADGLRLRRLTDRLGGTRIEPAAHAFALLLADGRTLTSADMRLTRAPALTRLPANPGASRLAERSPGRAIAVELEDGEHRVRALWRAVLRDGSRYLRQEVTLRALGAPLAVKEIALVQARAGAPGTGSAPRVAGEVKGSPIVAGNVFLAFEHPLAMARVDGGLARAWLPRELPLRPESPLTVSSVVGSTRAGQLRRDFLAYVERERAHPYRPFLHYNSWYDLAFGGKYDEAGALAVVRAFGDELVRRRQAVLSSYLFDDGWDDPRTLWGFHNGFPDGFTRVRQLAAAYGAAPGVWLSPWGGYGKDKQDRLAYGREQGFETNTGGFALSGPKYYERFRRTCLDMIARYGVNQFKIDGTGNASSAFPGSVFDSDFDAAIHLIGELRQHEPALFVNLTTGTYPSPFWLWHADSTWRGGDDHDFAGVGSWRQKWITYRDGDTFAGVVRKGPLYPLNSLMLHGLIYARHARNLDTDPGGDFRSEVRDYFGTGTQLQEMYITPALLKPEDWDALAEAARWSRRNAQTLRDTHWLDGDPARLEPYGWASWSATAPATGLVTLRNPADRPQRFELHLAHALELPEDARLARGNVVARSPWKSDVAQPPLKLKAEEAVGIELAPFEVKTLEITTA